jgi:Fe-S cluster biogenesis protein NfuA
LKGALLGKRHTPDNVHMTLSKERIMAEVGPVAEILKAHDGIVNVIDTTDGIVMISLEGGCVGCSSTPMTAMQMYYHLKQLDEVNDVVFVNGELPEFMRQFIDQKMATEAEDAELDNDDDVLANAN